MLSPSPAGLPGCTPPASCLRDRNISAELSLAVAWDAVGTSIGEGSPEQVLPSPHVWLRSAMPPSSGYPAVLQLPLASHIVLR